MDVPACCPACDRPLVWEIDLRVDRELAWQAPHAPTFPFDCPACGGRIEITFAWTLEPGAAPRRLRLVGGGLPAPPSVCILLVDRCPHGCTTKLGLQIDPEHPWAQGEVWPDEDEVLGGYRCPRCDGEGRLKIRPVVQRPQELLEQLAPSQPGEVEV